MAKFKLDWIAERYPNIVMSGGNYTALMGQIIAHQTERIAKKTLEVSQESFQKVLGKVIDEKRFVLPNISEALPKQSIFLRKGAEKGKLLTDTLRDKLNKDMRAALREFDLTNETSIVQRRGEMAGRVSTKMIRKFKEQISKTFESYTKKDPKFGGVPRNIKTIAITEIRSAVNDIKHQYVTRMVNENPDYEVEKKWIHNGHLSQQSRPGHVRLSRMKPIGEGDYFQLPTYEKVNGKFRPTGQFLQALHPHDPRLPGDEIINCNCDSEYVIKKKKQETP